MEWFLSFLTLSLRSQRNFELAQAYMDVFLTVRFAASAFIPAVPVFEAAWLWFWRI
jgi:hypothetical protein